MTYSIFKLFVYSHIVAGAISLLSFWVPVVVAKGKDAHVRYGRIFAYAMMVTAALAAVASVMTLVAPLATHPEVAPEHADAVRRIGGLMLGYLAALTFASAFSGLRAVRLKARYGAHKERAELGLNVLTLALAAAVAVVGYKAGSTLMVGLSLIGLIGVPSNIKLILIRPANRMEWFYQHMGSMLGAGIAAHTAFLVFGMSRIEPQLANQPLVWLAPTIIGVPSIILWTRYYRHRHMARMRHQTA